MSAAFKWKGKLQPFNSSEPFLLIDLHVSCVTIPSAPSNISSKCREHNDNESGKRDKKTCHMWKRVDQSFNTLGDLIRRLQIVFLCEIKAPKRKGKP